MALSPGDREYIKEVAENIASQVTEKVMERVLVWHIESCPHGRAIFASKWAMVGACITMAVTTGGFTAMFLKVIM